MTKLEKKVYNKMIETMDLDESELEGFDENSPIFEGDNEEGKISMNLDSIDSLELIVMIEKEWGLGEIDGEDMKELRTIKAIADYIKKHSESIEDE